MKGILLLLVGLLVIVLVAGCGAPLQNQLSGEPYIHDFVFEQWRSVLRFEIWPSGPDIYMHVRVTGYTITDTGRIDFQFSPFSGASQDGDYAYLITNYNCTAIGPDQTVNFMINALYYDETGRHESFALITWQNGQFRSSQFRGEAEITDGRSKGILQPSETK